MIKWVDFFGNENILMESSKGDVFHVIPNLRDEEGNSKVSILSRQAIIDMAELLKKSNLPGEE